MTKIVFYCPDPELKTEEQLNLEGGSGTLLSLLNLAYELATIGFCIEICGNCKFVLKDKLKSDQVKYTHIESECDFLLMCKTNTSDFVIIVGHGFSIFNNKIRLGKQVVYWCHNWIDVKKLYRICREGYIDKVIFVSKYHFLKSWKTIKFTPLALNYFNWIHNSIKQDYNNFLTIDNYPVLQKKLRIAFLSFPSINKGLPEVINIFHELQKQNINVELNIFGGVELYSSHSVGYGECQHLLFDGNGLCKEGIVLHGMLGKKKLFNIIDNMDLAISGMTGSETFCYALVESLARGILVVSSKKGGQIDYIKENENGYLVTNYLDATKKIINHINKPKHIHIAMKENAKNTVNIFNSIHITNIWFNSVFKYPRNKLFNCINVTIKMF